MLEYLYNFNRNKQTFRFTTNKTSFTYIRNNLSRVN
jgi:hypothetical protein